MTWAGMIQFYAYVESSSFESYEIGPIRVLALDVPRAYNVPLVP